MVFVHRLWDFLLHVIQKNQHGVSPEALLSTTGESETTWEHSCEVYFPSARMA